MAGIRGLRGAAEELRLLRKVFDSASDSVVITDLSGRILRVNSAFCRTSGYSEQELLGQNPRILKSGRHGAPFYAAFWNELSTRGSWQGEIWDRRRNGEDFPRWLSVSLLRNRRGRPACYIGISTDVSNITAAEERLRNLNRIYRAMSRTNRLIVHEKNRGKLVQEICRIAVEDGGVLMAWVGFTDPLSGAVNPESWYGREEGYLGAVSITSRDEPLGRGPTGTAVRENRRVFVADIAAEPSMLPWKEEAVSRGYRSSAAFPLTENGRVIGAFTTYAADVGFFDERALSLLEELTLDVSYALENIAREEERTKLREQYQQARKMEAVGRLAGGIAHDFNNILTAIIGSCDLGVTDSPEPHKTLFLEIRKTAQKAADLTTQLLTFSRRQVVRPRRIDLGELVAGMMDMLKRVVGDGIELSVIRGADLWGVCADPVQMERVIVNLAVNSRDAMPQGGVLTIATANGSLEKGPAPTRLGMKDGEYVLLTVSDTGHGMDAKTQESIYEPFFTTKEPGKGTGLGLATVYGIVQQSNGSISCSSEAGKGTTFSVSLPRAD